MYIVYSLTKLISILVLVYFFQVYGAILGFIISPLVAMLIWFKIPKFSINKFPYNKLIFFSIPLIIFAILSNMLQTLDLFFVKSLIASNLMTGYYTANQNIEVIPFYAVMALASILFPSISKSVSLNLHEKSRILISKSLRFALLLVTPSILIISGTSAQLITFLFSSNYLPGAESLSILVIGSGFFTFFILFSIILSGAGKPLLSSFLASIGVTISVLLCNILI